MKILITGVAGFIGGALGARLLAEGEQVVGLDNLDPYYDVQLKRARLSRLEGAKGFQFYHQDIAEAQALSERILNVQPEVLVHLAAQVGVRASINNPLAYARTNLMGFTHVLEACRYGRVKHLVFASSSSVYGASAELPYSVHHCADHALSFYGATKKSNEVMAHSYSALFGLPATGLRLFTVYGPWGRPDMSLFHFTRCILEGKPIQLHYEGRHERDFTFIDDVVEGIVRVIRRGPPGADPAWNPQRPDPASSLAPYRLYNLGGGNSVTLSHWIELLEKQLGKKAKRVPVPLQAGELVSTRADGSDFERDFGYRPETSLETGIRRFVEWYLEYHQGKAHS